MRYFSYNEYDPESPLADENGGYIVTLSEEEIRHEYYPWWYEQMCKKFGKEKVDELYTFEDCLTDWVVVNWAWGNQKMIDREYAKKCVGAGWHGLVDEAYDLIEPHEIQVTQVKEKFGQLRIYTTPITEEAHFKLYEIENKSATICETCGAPSKIQNHSGWLRSICNPCLEKLNVHTEA